jgi:hypothetical protein
VLSVVVRLYFVFLLRYKVFIQKSKYLNVRRRGGHFKEFCKAKLLFDFWCLIVAICIAFLTSEVWDVEIIKHLGLKQFAIMHGANRFFGLVTVKILERHYVPRYITHTVRRKKKKTNKKQKKKKKARDGVKEEERP